MWRWRGKEEEQLAANETCSSIAATLELFFSSPCSIFFQLVFSPTLIRGVIDLLLLLRFQDAFIDCTSRNKVLEQSNE